MDRKLTIGHLYPDLLNLYGDRGNIQCFRKRLEWRGIEAQVIPFLSGDAIDFHKLDIVLLGGGSDREQELVCGHLQNIRRDFKDYVEDGGVVLAVCGGYQLLGKYYRTDSKTIEGLSILDITTEWEPKRLIRNIVLNSPLFDTPVVGFENHGGRTYIGSHTPFGKVFFGLGNTGKSGYEGVVYKNVIATYLHGPLLPKNPHVCDYLLKKALIRKYGPDIRLNPLPDELEKLANSYISGRYSDKKYVLKETIKRYT
ncbi:type 1 glutamine amidotransferase [Luxibacter massiliensis]|uniref:type 1 glutamine amidotransferase n=1 Tax=Luxibacter massiliensis TaxID=2219695 RepID=UPI000F06C99A|nr:glutamine amidotransferase [Luxibacter massiliensis]